MKRYRIIIYKWLAQKWPSNVFKTEPTLQVWERSPSNMLMPKPLSADTELLIHLHCSSRCRLCPQVWVCHRLLGHLHEMQNQDLYLLHLLILLVTIPQIELLDSSLHIPAFRGGTQHTWMLHHPLALVDHRYPCQFQWHLKTFSLTSTLSEPTYRHNWHKCWVFIFFSVDRNILETV